MSGYNEGHIERRNERNPPRDERGRLRSEDGLARYGQAAYGHGRKHQRDVRREDTEESQTSDRFMNPVDDPTLARSIHPFDDTSGEPAPYGHPMHEGPGFQGPSEVVFHEDPYAGLFNESARHDPRDPADDDPQLGDDPEELLLELGSGLFEGQTYEERYTDEFQRMCVVAGDAGRRIAADHDGARFWSAAAKFLPKDRFNGGLDTVEAAKRIRAQYDMVKHYDGEDQRDYRYRLWLAMNYYNETDLKNNPRETRVRTRHDVDIGEFRKCVMYIQMVAAYPPARPERIAAAAKFFTDEEARQVQGGYDEKWDIDAAAKMIQAEYDAWKHIQFNDYDGMYLRNIVNCCKDALRCYYGPYYRFDGDPAPTTTA